MTFEEQIAIVGGGPGEELWRASVLMRASRGEGAREGVGCCHGWTYALSEKVAIGDGDRTHLLKHKELQPVAMLLWYCDGRRQKHPVSIWFLPLVPVSQLLKCTDCTVR